MSKILLVGGEGYIGRALKKRLAGDFETLAASRKSGFDMCQQESALRALKGGEFDILVVLASTISTIQKNEIELDGDLFKNNLFCLNSLLKALSMLDKKPKLIYFSSMSVYGTGQNQPLSEGARLAPLHEYGLSKLYAESLVRFYAEKNNLKSVIFRPAGVFGGDRKSGYIYSTIKKLINSETVTINTEGLGYWEAINIDDLTLMVFDFLKKYDFKKNCEVFNLGYGKETDFIKTAFLLKKMVGSKSEIVVENRDYERLFMSRKKISKVIDTKALGYKKALKKYIDEVGYGI